MPTRRSPSTAAVVPRALRKVSWISKAYAYIGEISSLQLRDSLANTPTAAHLNWYRAHLLVFSLLPLFASLVFFGSNGRTTVSFTDSLFMCYSVSAWSLGEVPGNAQYRNTEVGVSAPGRLQRVRDIAELPLRSLRQAVHHCSSLPALC